MGIGANPSYNALNMTATGTVFSGAGQIAGYLITSSTTATITIYDNTAASGTVVQGVTGSLTITTPTFIQIPASLSTGCHVVITGTANITVFWLKA